MKNNLTDYGTITLHPEARGGQAMKMIDIIPETIMQEIIKDYTSHAPIICQPNSIATEAAEKRRAELEYLKNMPHCELAMCYIDKY